MNQSNKTPIEINCIPLSDVRSKSIEWVWNNRIPKSTLTLIEGDGGNGKSTIVADLCSRLSAGIALPDDPRKEPLHPLRVLLLSGEDDPSMVLRPRFEAHGANLDNILFDDKAILLDPNGIEAIRKTILNQGIQILVIDPIVAYLGIRVNMNKGNDVRSVLGPLVKMSRDLSCTVLLVRHFNKTRDSLASQKGSGSVDFRNSARSTLQVVFDAQSEKHYVVLEKSNYAAQAKTLPFSIKEGVVNWGSPCELSADEINGYQNDPVFKSALDEAKSFLKSELTSPKMAKFILSSAREAGISEKTLRRAKHSLAIKSVKLDNVWSWELPI